MRAPHGGVLISESTRESLGDAVEVEKVHGLELKGVEELVNAYVVKSVRPKEPSE